MNTTLTHAQVQQFKIDGYLILKDTFSAQVIADVRSTVETHLSERQPPFELEAAVQYPGAPASVNAKGGESIRRLLHAYDRHPAFKAIAQNQRIATAIAQLLRSDHLWMNPNHHNCVMTKLPKYSSKTMWHRDTRYWQFSNKYLINAWTALGQESQKNGAMLILPGSHRWDVQEDALDEDQFLIPQHVDNVERIATARLLELAVGETLLFSAHCFHAAGSNQTNDVKLSVVFTYHDDKTQAINHTNSGKLDEIKVL